MKTKFFTVEGFVSLLFLVTFSFILNLNWKVTENKQPFDLSKAHKIVLPYSQQDSLNYAEMIQFINFKQMDSFKLVGKEVEREQILHHFQQRVKKMVNDGDSSYAVKMIFGKQATFGDFMNTWHIFKKEKAKIFIVNENYVIVTFPETLAYKIKYPKPKEEPLSYY